MSRFSVNPAVAGLNVKVIYANLAAITCLVLVMAYNRSTQQADPAWFQTAIFLSLAIGAVNGVIFYCSPIVRRSPLF